MANLYDLDSYIKIIEWKGIELFGEHFKIYKEDSNLINRLLAYFLKNNELCSKNGISLKKGILLTGPVGCGKTTLMSLLRLFQPADNRYIMKSCREVSFEFIQEGYSVILKYSRQAFNQDKPKIFCFDDLGTETNLKYYGNECNVMAEVILSRYDQYITKHMITHVTTNLNSSEIEGLYGTRVRSRMKEMFNLISFQNSARDKRGHN